MFSIFTVGPEWRYRRFLQKQTTPLKQKWRWWLTHVAPISTRRAHWPLAQTWIVPPSLRSLPLLFITMSYLGGSRSIVKKKSNVWSTTPLAVNSIRLQKSRAPKSFRLRINFSYRLTFTPGVVPATPIRRYWSSWVGENHKLFADQFNNWLVSDHKVHRCYQDQESEIL